MWKTGNESSIEIPTVKDSCGNMKRTLGDLDTEDSLHSLAVFSSVSVQEITGLQILTCICSNNLASHLKLAQHCCTTHGVSTNDCSKWREKFIMPTADHNDL